MGTQFTQEQLQHYIDHPDEVDATNIPLVEALAHAELSALADNEAREQVRREAGVDYDDPDRKAAEEAVKDAEAKIAADKAADDAKAKADAEAKAKADAAKAASTTVDEAGKPRVMAKDGKNTLPFEVLEDARQGKAAAEGALADAQQQVVALSERLKAIERGEDPADTEGKTTDELLAAVTQAAEQAPWAKEPLDKIAGVVRALQARVDELEVERDETEEAAIGRLLSTRDAAFERNATLVLWKSQHPALFKEAQAFDATLRSNPEMSARYKSFDDRFKHAVDLVVASHPGQKLPMPEPVAAADPVTGKVEEPAKTAAVPAKAAASPSADVTARAKEVLAKAAAEPVRTLTDLPGGAGEQTTQEILERMSPLEIAAKFGQMTAQQVVDWVTTH